MINDTTVNMDVRARGMEGTMDRCSSDQRHQYSIRKMTDRHQKCIPECVPDGIVKFGKYRVEIQEYHEIYNAKCDKQYMQYRGHAAAHVIYNIQVKVQESAKQEHDQIGRAHV